ncbi:MAG: trimethylamine methyltransferase family protein, partial [Rhizobiaceae bacterium]
TEYIYPVIGDRTSPKEWVEKGRPDIIETAIAEKNRILSDPVPRHISSELDASIRRKFPIQL